MCGIVGYVGARGGADDRGGPRHLEYRGYDSAGVASHDGRGARGRRAAAASRGWRGASRDAAPGPSASATRAGRRTAGHRRERAPAHRRSGDVVVVHNGIIENHLALRERLSAEGDSLLVGDRHRGHRAPARARTARARGPGRGRAPGARASCAGRLRARVVSTSDARAADRRPSTARPAARGGPRRRRDLLASDVPAHPGRTPARW